MSEYTSFRTGGPAELLVFPKTEEELSFALSVCAENGILPFVFGNGTNLLVSDEGIKGVSIRLAGDFERITLLDDETVTCSAGTMLSKLCLFALDHSLAGLEFAYGIPGTAGGAAFMNAGAYGGEMKDVVTNCRHLDMLGRPGSFTAEELDFGYRHSVYSNGGFIITDVTLRLKKGVKDEISARMKELLSRRKEKQPLELPSAGSFFKRPKDGYAGKLIEECGLKGFSVGGAQVSTKHAGFVVNTGGASTSDILRLGDAVRGKVKAETGVTLEREVRYIG